MVLGLHGGIFDPYVLCLYNEGDLCTSTIGGWSLGGQENSNMVMTENTNYIRFENTEYATSYCYAWARIFNAIPISNYSKLVVSVKKAYWGYTYASDMDSQNSSLQILDADFNELYVKNFKDINSAETWEIDISNFNVNAKFQFKLGPESYIEIYSIKLIR